MADIGAQFTGNSTQDSFRRIVAHLEQRGGTRQGAGHHGTRAAAPLFPEAVLARKKCGGRRPERSGDPGRTASRQGFRSWRTALRVANRQRGKDHRADLGDFYRAHYRLTRLSSPSWRCDAAPRRKRSPQQLTRAAPGIPCAFRPAQSRDEDRCKRSSASATRQPEPHPDRRAGHGAQRPGFFPAFCRQLHSGGGGFASRLMNEVRKRRAWPTASTAISCRSGNPAR